MKMIKRNIRYRYPIPSYQLNDIFDEIYDDVVELIGYQNSSGVTTVSGIILESYGDINSNMEDEFGSIDGDYTTAMNTASGYYDYSLNQLNNINSIVTSIFNN
jgi:hypothetical protein